MKNRINVKISPTTKQQTADTAKYGKPAVIKKMSLGFIQYPPVKRLRRWIFLLLTRTGPVFSSRLA